jgi:Membrane carboxypeptidase/penicillin-binding protein
VAGILRVLISLSLVAVLLGGATVIGGYVYLKPSLPDVESLKTVRLQTPLQVFTADGQLIAQFGEKRRDPVQINEVPLGPRARVSCRRG